MNHQWLIIPSESEPVLVCVSFRHQCEQKREVITPAIATAVTDANTVIRTICVTDSGELVVIVSFDVAVSLCKCAVLDRVVRPIPARSVDTFVATPLRFVVVVASE